MPCLGAEPPRFPSYQGPPQELLPRRQAEEKGEEPSLWAQIKGTGLSPQNLAPLKSSPPPRASAFEAEEETEGPSAALLPPASIAGSPPPIDGALRVMGDFAKQTQFYELFPSIFPAAPKGSKNWWMNGTCKFRLGRPSFPFQLRYAPASVAIVLWPFLWETVMMVNIEFSFICMYSTVFLPPFPVRRNEAMVNRIG